MSFLVGRENSSIRSPLRSISKKKKFFSVNGISPFISECSIPHCASIHSTYPCSYSCGVSSCSITPSLPYPSICPVPVHYPVQMLPTQCPMSCPSVCAPACNSLCCQSFVGRTNSAEQQPPSQYVTEQNRLGDAEAVEGNTYIWLNALVNHKNQLRCYHFNCAIYCANKGL